MSDPNIIEISLIKLLNKLAIDNLIIAHKVRDMFVDELWIIDEQTCTFRKNYLVIFFGVLNRLTVFDYNSNMNEESEDK